jgi:OFA family oxalate/formate antiporter-like MFS transporter
MKKYLTVIASFIVMLCIGSVYAWSIIASELINEYGFSAIQSQIIFGSMIAVFPVTMIFVGQLSTKIPYRYFGYISGLLFFLGYFIAGYSQSNFWILLLGISILAGTATGFGYWVALTSPVLWFPEKKGLVTGIAAAGFGLGAVFMSELSEIILDRGQSVLEFLKIIGVSYGLTIAGFSNVIFQVDETEKSRKEQEQKVNYLRSKMFWKLFSGLFLGTFAGLLIIGSLRIIGGQYDISNHNLILGIALFAIANFFGRLVWGFLSDHIGATFSIFLALLFQSLSIISLNIFVLTDLTYLVKAMLIGFGFGGNFVLFAKETAQVYGVKNLGTIYPYVFTGYAIAGIAGPMSGGLLYDISGSFFIAIILASGMSLLGSLLFLVEFLRSR